MSAKVELSDGVVSSLSDIQHNHECVTDAIACIEEFIHSSDAGSNNPAEALSILQALRQIRYLKSKLVSLYGDTN